MSPVNSYRIIDGFFEQCCTYNNVHTLDSVSSRRLGSNKFKTLAQINSFELFSLSRCALFAPSTRQLFSIFSCLSFFLNKVNFSQAGAKFCIAGLSWQGISYRHLRLGVGKMPLTWRCENAKSKTGAPLHGWFDPSGQHETWQGFSGLQIRIRSNPDPEEARDPDAKYLYK